MTDRFLKTSEVAVLFGCNRRTVVRWCEEGFIKAKKWNNRWMVDRDSLQKQWNLQWNFERFKDEIETKGTNGT